MPHTSIEKSSGSSVSVAYRTKIIVLGDHGVGKSAFVNSYFKGESAGAVTRSRSESLPAPSCISKKVKYGTRNVDVLLQDTAGQERFRSLTTSYFRGANGCLLFFNVHNQASFDNLSSWLDDIHRYCRIDNIGIVLVGITNRITGYNTNGNYFARYMLNNNNNSSSSNNNNVVPRRSSSRRSLNRCHIAQPTGASATPKSNSTRENPTVSYTAPAVASSTNVQLNDNNNNTPTTTTTTATTACQQVVNRVIKNNNRSSSNNSSNNNNNSSSNNHRSRNYHNHNDTSNYKHRHQYLSNDTIDNNGDDEEEEENDETYPRIISKDQAKNFAHCYEIPYREVDLEKNYDSVEEVIGRCLKAIIKNSKRSWGCLDSDSITLPSSIKEPQRVIKTCCSCGR